MPQESLFSSAIRSLLKSIFAVIGIFVGFIPAFMIVAAVMHAPEMRLSRAGAPVVVEDGKGQRNPLHPDSPVILEVNIHGVIGGKECNSDTVAEQLLSSQELPFKRGQVKAILLNINTVGGTVFDSDKIYRSLLRYKEVYKAPVYAYVDGLCFSGGYYVASACDKIYSSDVSMIGSIGVIMEFMNFSETMDKIGVKSKTMVQGKHKDAMNPMRPWEKGEEKHIESNMKETYERFLNIVLKARPDLNKEFLVNELGAQFVSAAQAVEHNLIDKSSMERHHALEELAEACGIEDNYQVVQFNRQNWIADIMEGKTPIQTGHLIHEHQIQGNYGNFNGFPVFN